MKIKLSQEEKKDLINWEVLAKYFEDTGLDEKGYITKDGKRLEAIICPQIYYRGIPLKFYENN